MHAIKESRAHANDSKKFPQPRPTRIAIVRKSLLAITGDDATAAMILDKFLYWAGRGHRDDGWIWKSSKELANVDLMGIKSARSVQRRVARLVEVGYLERRSNPDNPLDNIPQYRANLRLIYQDVTSAGHSLDGWTIPSNLHSGERSRQNDAAPRQNDAAPRQNDAAPRQNDATLPERTNQRDKQRASTSEGSNLEVNRQAIETDDHDTPAQKLLAMSQRAGVHLSIMQAENAWETLKDKLGDDVWDYIKFKLADLDETDYPRRRKYEYLIGDSDIERWVELNGEVQVGAHTSEFHHEPEPAPTPPSPPGEPVGARELSESERDWGEISERLHRLDLSVIESDAIDMIHPFASRDGALWLWAEMREVRSVMNEHVQAVANDLEFKIKWMEK